MPGKRIERSLWYLGSSEKNYFPFDVYINCQSSRAIYELGPGSYWTTNKADAEQRGRFIHEAYCPTGLHTVAPVRTTKRFFVSLCQHTPKSYLEDFFADFGLTPSKKDFSTTFARIYPHYTKYRTLHSLLFVLLADLFHDNMSVYADCLSGAGYDGIMDSAVGKDGSRHGILCTWQPQKMVINRIYEQE